MCMQGQEMRRDNISASLEQSSTSMQRKYKLLLNENAPILHLFIHVTSQSLTRGRARPVSLGM